MSSQLQTGSSSPPGFQRRLDWIPPALIFCTLVLGAIFAPWIAPHDPYDLKSLRLEHSALPPAWLDPAPPADAWYPLGTDVQGRDVLSAVLFGLRVSLLVGLGGTLLAMLAGIALGLCAGYWRGWLDALIMRLADVQLAFPSMLIALFMLAIWGPGGSGLLGGLWKIIVAVAVVRWVVYARLVRGSVLAEREKDYVSAMRALGAGAPRILLRHILPNLLTPVLVVSMVEFASIVMLEATLSFLGLGAPVTRPSLGMLIKFGYEEFFNNTWWIWLFPGVALVLLVFSLNWLFDVLHRADS